MDAGDYKKASTCYLIGNIFNKGIAFLTVPIFTRILSTSDYGIVTTYNSWIGIVSMLLGFALHMAIRSSFKATVTLKDKSERHMDYIDSWNQVLGRNIRKMCKFCVNGVGTYADISCGDLWNLNQNQRPEFTEGKGQNIIFARSKAGSDLLTEARDGVLILTVK